MEKPHYCSLQHSILEGFARVFSVSQRFGSLWTLVYLCMFAVKTLYVPTILIHLLLRYIYLVSKQKLCCEHSIARKWSTAMNAETDFTKCDMFLDQHPCWHWNNIAINQSDLKNKFIIFVKFRLIISVSCLCHSSIMSSDFKDYSWIRKVRLRFREMVNITFLDKNVVPGSTIYVDPGTHLTQQNQDVRHEYLCCHFTVAL